jgi:hypothetical protein
MPHDDTAQSEGGGLAAQARTLRLLQRRRVRSAIVLGKPIAPEDEAAASEWASNRVAQYREALDGVARTVTLAVATVGAVGVGAIGHGWLRWLMFSAALFLAACIVAATWIRLRVGRWLRAHPARDIEPG